MQADNTTQSVSRVEVRFLGGALVAGLPKTHEVELDAPITALQLFERLAHVLGQPELRHQVDKHFTVLVNGTSIRHLQGWETLVAPGASVAVVAPMGGG